MRTKQQILDAVSKLLDNETVVVRVQRELSHAQKNDKKDQDQFITGKRVTIIVSAEEK